jgi:hypothetical protein
MLEENLKYVQDKILSSARKSNRKLSDIRLIAVSKTHPISAILKCLDYGIIDFAENKAIEFRDKSEIIKNEIIWHYVGHLQTNKVKYVVKSADYIHSVESLKLAEEINKRAKLNNKIQKVLIEVKTSGEESKFGLKNYDELNKLLSECQQLENIEAVGLMTMAPFTSVEATVRKSFTMLRELRDKVSSNFKSISELSMGMTNDYEIAIEEGATMLRIGTAIFDKRDKSLSWSDK